jgi:hypothetical protein
MKAYLLFSITLLVGLSLACKKQENDLKNDKFTDCPSNSSCSYLFIDYGDIKDNRVVPGNFRVFQAKFKNQYSTASYFFKIDRRDGQFYIASSQIRNTVGYTFYCPACNSIQLSPAAGYIKGSRIANNKWLIDAAIIMTIDNVSQYRDTVHLKQYFDLASNAQINIQ